MSLVTFNRADLVLWSFLNTDWKVSYSEFDSRKECSWVNSTFSKIFEMKGRLEIGLKWPRSDTSRFGFFKRGVTEACFRQSGIVPVLKHMLIKKKNRRSGPIVSTICLKKCDGILSYGQKVGFRWSIIFLEVGREIKSNMLQIEEHLVLSGRAWEVTSDCGLDLVVFSTKNDRMFSHRRSDTSGKPSTAEFKTASIVENKTLCLWWFFETNSERNLDLADLTAFWKTERDSLKMS